uniref:NTF2 domain-containing protein n=1 Tax=Glossina palpalis gambiensis TaxID=67801 RepID=A0A1B0C3I2_9MUSC
MVMDATQPQQPSPQSVGREFVRQYYTLLNKAPNHLHRFYNNNSSFVHGESTLVVGQKNIHNRIQQLNFHDCHAKISQVDAQATLGNGVVVQVTGELSNDGQPMRRFTQTFVLASQSPKKYYVHNDIFRYQDLYSDEEIDGESRSENDDEHDQQVATQTGQVVPGTATITEQQPGQVLTSEQHQQQIPTQVVAGGSGAAGVMSQRAQAVYYSMPTGAGTPMAVLPPPPGAAPVPLGANFAAAGVPPPQQQSVQTNAVAVNQLNGVVGPEELLATMPQQNVVQQPPLANQAPSPVVPQPAGAVSVATSAVIAQVPTCVSGVPVVTATTGLPQNVVTTMPSYPQQTPLIQTHILQQQQQQPPQQQPIPNSVSQQTHMQHQPVQNLTTSAAMTDVEDSICSMVITPNATLQVEQTRPNTAANVVASGQSSSSSVSGAVPEVNPAPVVEDFKIINDQQQQEKYEAAKQQQQSEPKTYANLFKSTSSSPSSFVNAALQQQQQIQQQQQSSSSAYQTTGTISSTTFSQSTLGNTSMSIYGNRGNNENNSSARQDTNSQGAPLPQRQNAKGFNKDFDQRRTNNNQQFGDNQQLFLGNIPHHASEEELKALFARFGTVVDLRILSKGSNKLPPGIRNPQNYGFITYEDAESVQNCLAHCPLYFPENSPDRQKLNVEEKKPRARTNDLPPRQSMGGGAGGMNNNINNNQRNMNSSGPASRSLSNSGSAGGSMMRGNSNNNNNMSRGGSSGPRMGGSFNRSDNRASNGGSGSQMRGCNNNAQSSSSSYGVRR